MADERGETGRSDRRADLLAAAARRFVETGIRRTTMEDVAREAGAGKATLYRYFSNKDALIDALLDREAARFRREVREAMAGHAGAADRLGAGFVAGVQFFVHHPVLTRGREEEPGLLLDRVTATAGPLVETGLDLFEDVIRAGVEAGELRDVDARAGAEFVMRLILSYFTFPPMHVRAAEVSEARAFARDLVAGGLIRRAPVAAT